MATVTLPYTLIADTLAKASEVQGNFDALKSFIAAEVIQKDATVAFTAVPAGPPLDPSTNDQLVRKLYVDRVLQKGKEPFTLTSEASEGGSVTFPIAFASAPVVQLTVQIGSNFDFIPNLQGVTTTGFSWRVFQQDSTPVSGSGTLHWVAFRP